MDVAAWRAFAACADAGLARKCAACSAHADASRQETWPSQASLASLRQAGLASLCLSYSEEASQARHDARSSRFAPLTRAQRLLRERLPSFWALFLRLPASLKAAGEADASFSSPELAWVAPALEQGLERLCETVAEALRRRAALAAALGAEGTEEAFARSLRALLHAKQPLPLADLLTAALAQQLCAFAAEAGLPLVADEEEEEEGEGAESEAEEEEDEAAAYELGDSPHADMEGVEGCEESDGARLARLAACVAPLGLGAALEEAVGRACESALRAHLLRRAGGGFGRALLSRARRWLSAVPLRFAAAALRAAGRAPALRALRGRLDYALHAGLGALRGAHLFDAVVDFPDSAPALADLRACLRRTRLAAALGRDFRAALRRRLLHAGAATPVILAQYVGCFRALRLLDPSGALLEAVSPPIRAYLCPGRRDAVRCIVQLLTGEGDEAEGSSLMEQLAGGEAPEEAAELEAEVAPAAGDAWARWRPPRVHREGGPAAAVARGDAVSQLVSVFGSRDLFVAEYRQLLAERLLARPGYDCEREVRTLELLRLRFGDAPLHAAEVMLKDVADSRRLDANCRAPGGAVGATVLSHFFWPPPAAEAASEAALPPPVQAALDGYAARYEALKAPRKLLWRRGAGCVQLELRLGGEARAFAAQPLQAALIWQFAGRDCWRLEALAAALGLAPAAALAKAGFWVKAGVLRESRDADGALLLSTAEAFGAGGGGGGGGGGAEELADADAPSAEAAAAELVYEQYLLGMLTNFDVLSAERIHNMLTMFVSEPPYEKSAAQTDDFLRRMAAEEKISLADEAARTYRKRS